jgi:archaellum biogenesis ATPase FlaH
LLNEPSWLGINKFLHKCDRGYFTILGAPGSGKTAILAKYVTENPHVIYYSAQFEGKNQADEFLTSICNQLINQYPHVGATHASPQQTNINEGRWFLSLLLQKISDSLEPNQPLIIAIDALDAIAPNSQAASSNLFYLPLQWS